jgi:hypothetical protein
MHPCLEKVSPCFGPGSGFEAQMRCNRSHFEGRDVIDAVKVRPCLGNMANIFMLSTT